MNTSKTKFQALSRHSVRSCESSLLRLKDNDLSTHPTPITYSQCPAECKAGLNTSFNRVVRARKLMQAEIAFNS